jgi:hypothetical protein
MHAYRGGISSILISITSLLRGLLLLVRGRPKTLLRVLCVVAFDTLHTLRNSKRLPLPKLRILAALLDFGACANAALDNKAYCRTEFRATRQMLQEAGLRSCVSEFVRRLRDLEMKRPANAGDHRHFQRVESYREAVVRLALGMVATTAMGNQCIDEGIWATYCDDDLVILFRIVMQCQIIDDVLDYSQDLQAGLPSFLTASNSVVQAMKWTWLAASGYSADRDLSRCGSIFPLRMALFAVSACAKLVILLRAWRLAY